MSRTGPRENIRVRVVIRLLSDVIVSALAMGRSWPTFMSATMVWDINVDHSYTNRGRLGHKCVGHDLNWHRYRRMDDYDLVIEARREAAWFERLFVARD
jgi:hypothetical protein